MFIELFLTEGDSMSQIKILRLQWCRINFVCTACGNLNGKRGNCARSIRFPDGIDHLI